jgi:hypothetical protein
MPDISRSAPYFGVFTQSVAAGEVGLQPHPQRPSTLPDPRTGHQLRIESVQVSGAICPSCQRRAQGGFVSFVADLRLVYACPHCRGMVWINGA